MDISLLKESVDNGDRIMAELKIAIEKCVEQKKEIDRLREELHRLSGLVSEEDFAIIMSVLGED
jgi:hypothetical protein